jgi:hypothetical protein
MTPMSFEFLCLVTGCAELVHDFQDRFREPFARHVPTVIELEWE